MSRGYWIAWAVLSVANVALFLYALWLLRRAHPGPPTLSGLGDEVRVEMFGSPQTLRLTAVSIGPGPDEMYATLDSSKREVTS